MAEAELSPATRTAVDVGMAQVDRLTEDLTRIRDQIAVISRRQPACRALQAAHYGIGPLTSVAIWSEMGVSRPGFDGGSVLTRRRSSTRPARS
jgi:transposase